MYLKGFGLLTLVRDGSQNTFLADFLLASSSVCDGDGELGSGSLGRFIFELFCIFKDVCFSCSVLRYGARSELTPLVVLTASSSGGRSSGEDLFPAIKVMNFKARVPSALRLYMCLAYHRRVVSLCDGWYALVFRAVV
ncbi:hypothetical protein F2Q69_00001578 [Brassica cretica]|uniref:Uncharacterized protein n=1 Tax=Brassica cretica TaxID=69181 RepID=A0A8S9PCG0_BRACR|nr:hypothetical protein F2Q69_00001578 [Brassica cretica]